MHPVSVLGNKPPHLCVLCLCLETSHPTSVSCVFVWKHPLPDSVKRKKAMSRILWIGKINLKKNSKRPLFNPRPPPTFWQYHCNVICQAWRIIALSKMNQRKMKAFLRDKMCSLCISGANFSLNVLFLTSEATYWWACLDRDTCDTNKEAQKKVVMSLTQVTHPPRWKMFSEKKKKSKKSHTNLEIDVAPTPHGPT